MRATPTGDACSPGVGEKQRDRDVRWVCNTQVFSVPPAIFDGMVLVGDSHLHRRSRRSSVGTIFGEGYEPLIYLPRIGKKIGSWRDLRDRGRRVLPGRHCTNRLSERLRTQEWRRCGRFFDESPRATTTVAHSTRASSVSTRGQRGIADVDSRLRAPDGGRIYRRNSMSSALTRSGSSC